MTVKEKLVIHYASYSCMSDEGNGAGYSNTSHITDILGTRDYCSSIEMTLRMTTYDSLMCTLSFARSISR
jgi:hypothetical protein